MPIKCSSLIQKSSPLSRDKSNLTGIAYGAGAGALWGLVFLAPALVRNFNPLLLSVTRYLCYGLIAAILIAPRLRKLMARLSRSDWFKLGWLALLGNTLYYVLLSNAVQIGGIAMASLVIGFLPVAVTIIGSHDQGAVPLQKLVPSLLLCAAGAVCIGWQALAHTAGETAGTQLIGMA